MRAVMIVPTGVGAAIGGHSGDATSAANLLAAAVDELIIHPNIANASDLYSMPPNTLYVEGSMIDAMLDGTIWLRPRLVRGWNRVLVLVNEFNELTQNAVNAASSVHGVDARIEILDVPLLMSGGRDVGTATGVVHGVDELIAQLRKGPRDYDAIAIHTPVNVDAELVKYYSSHGGINPWGLVEAIVSGRVTRAMHIPCAHAPLELDPPPVDEVSYHRVAPELICGSHLVSVLAGLSRSPSWGSRVNYSKQPGDIGVEDIDVLISPLCYGYPHACCHSRGVPIMWVAENTTCQMDRYRKSARDDDIRASNYLEAAGRLLAMSIGRSTRSMRSDTPGLRLP